MMGMQNAMAVAAQRSADERQHVRAGIVDSYDPATYSVKVKFLPNGVTSGWIPIASAFVGTGWGMQAGPAIGDMVTVVCLEGDLSSGIVVGGLFNDQDRPMPVPSGEMWIQHASGSLLKFLNDGTVQLVAATSIESTAPAWNHIGPVNIEGALTVKNRITGTGGIAVTNSFGPAGSSSYLTGDFTITSGDVVVDGYSLKLHKHTGVQTGSGTSGPATP